MSRLAAATSRPRVEAASARAIRGAMRPGPMTPQPSTVIARPAGRLARPSAPGRLADRPERNLEDPVRARPRHDEPDRLGHVLRLHHPGEGGHVRRPPAAHREVGRNTAGADARAPNAALAELVIERRREPDL